MSIQLLALDLDGTTLHNDHLTISPRNLSALKTVVDKGIHLVPSTGRARGRLPAFLKTLPGIRYVITSNGATLTDLTTEEILYQNVLPFETAERLFEDLEKLPVYIELYAGGNCYTDTSRNKIFRTLPFSPHRRTMIEQNRQAIPGLLAYLREKKLAVEKLNLPLLFPEQQALVQKILDAFPGLAITSSLAQNAEVNAQSCNKGAALSFLCTRLGIKPSQVMALGDNGNDVEMLRFAGIAVVPANAAECAKACAHVLPVSNEEDAVAMAIEKFIGLSIKN